uniref:Uncharacterized protein n=1 Tax=Panagrolaimus sp. ES5 TaxID=591445 RepID=A0AC34FWB8_9BILA
MEFMFIKNVAQYCNEHSPPTVAKESLRYQNKCIKKITKEDVLKKFLDSKIKSPYISPNKQESSSSPRSTSAEKTSIRNKNILHGVHIPSKILAHSLRKKENKYFYCSTVSSFEGNMDQIILTTTPPPGSPSSNISQPMSSPSSPQPSSPSSFGMEYQIFSSPPSSSNTKSLPSNTSLQSGGYFTDTTSHCVEFQRYGIKT